MERPSVEVSELISHLHDKSIGPLGPLRPLGLRAASDARPYLDALTCQSDHYGRNIERTGTQSRLLIEPTIVPDLSHTGVKYTPAHQPARGTPLFYPNGEDALACRVFSPSQPSVGSFQV